MVEDLYVCDENITSKEFKNIIKESLKWSENELFEWAKKTSEGTYMISKDNKLKYIDDKLKYASDKFEKSLKDTKVLFDVKEGVIHQILSIWRTDEEHMKF